jgi:hypothetical protein
MAKIDYTTIDLTCPVCQGKEFAWGAFSPSFIFVKDEKNSLGRMARFFTVPKIRGAHCLTCDYIMVFHGNIRFKNVKGSGE